MSKRSHTPNVQDLYLQAVEHHEQGELEKAIPLYQEVIENVEGGDLLYYNLGLAQYELGEYEEARDSFEHAVALQDEDADYWYNLGLACKQLDLFFEAALAYKHALHIHPDDLDVLFNLGCCLKDSGALEEAITVYQHILELDDAYGPAVNNMAYIRHLQGELDEAERLYRRLLQIDPENTAACYMLEAIHGKQVAAPPEEYVRELFDNYSEDFEENLLEDLAYRVPNQIVRILEKRPENTCFQNALDLGCGTGLCGKLLAPRCNRLTGVDLSPKMLAQAGEKRVYDNLYEAELVAFLEGNGDSYDLLVAADVLTYLGDLQPVFSALKKRCDSAALVCFSVETCDEGWELRTSGRFAHSQSYVEQLLQVEGFTLEHCTATNVRKEGEGWIQGAIFLLSCTP